MGDAPQREQLAMFGLPPEPVPDSPPPAEPAPPPRPPATAADRRARALQRSLLAPVEAAPVEPMPRIVGGVCSERTHRLAPDGSLAPCPRVRCPHHLAIDVGEPERIGRAVEAPLVCSTAGQEVEMGRRPGLSAYPETHGEAVEFIELVVARLETMPETCALDVIARYPDGAPVEAIARVLGVTPEVVRRDTESAVAKTFDPTAGDAWSNLEEAAARTVRAARRPAPGKVGEPGPVPTAIVRREEREAPEPREATAGEIFTF